MDLFGGDEPVNPPKYDNALINIRTCFDKDSL